ncbi:MAG: hypothetical protein JWM16_5387 [Verrucomicrobiales bacterium]|nr:hypothetical protein [Verrucomicrobiales bacterium]
METLSHEQKLSGGCEVGEQGSADRGQGLTLSSRIRPLYLSRFQHETAQERSRVFLSQDFSLDQRL